MRLGIISNPSSRMNRRRPRLASRLHEMLRPQDRMIETRHRDELHDALVALRDAGMDVLAVNGGDGTVHACLTEMIPIWGERPLPKLLLMRGGTMNTVATSFGVRGNPISILRRVVEEPLPTVTIQRPVLRVTVADEVRYGFIFGTGLLYAFLAEYYANGDVSPWVAAKTLGRSIASVAVNGETAQRLLTPFDATIVADGQVWRSGPHLAVAASTQEELGLGFVVFRRAAERAGHFHALTIQGRLAGVIRGLPAFALGRRPPRRAFDEGVLAQMALTAERPIGWMIDGELYDPAEQITVESGPTVEVLRPA